MAESPLREKLAHVLGSFDVRDREAFVQKLEPLYDDRVHFRDPMQEARGLPAFLDLNRRLGKGAKEVRFVVHDTSGDEALFYLHWTMTFVPKLGPSLDVEGVSRLTAERGRVTEHIDYWDLGELFFSAIPGGRKILHAIFKPFV